MQPAGRCGLPHRAVDGALRPCYHEFMKQSHDKPKGRVSEPVQVYLDSPDRARLERLATELDATKSDVLRRALEALEVQLSDPSAHPALRIIGLAAGHKRRGDPGYDVAEGHDRFLAESEASSWKAKGKVRRAR